MKHLRQCVVNLTQSLLCWQLTHSFPFHFDCRHFLDKQQTGVYWAHRRKMERVLQPSPPLALSLPPLFPLSGYHWRQWTTITNTTEEGRSEAVEQGNSERERKTTNTDRATRDKHKTKTQSDREKEKIKDNIQLLCEELKTRWIEDEPIPIWWRQI